MASIASLFVNMRLDTANFNNSLNRFATRTERRMKRFQGKLKKFTTLPALGGAAGFGLALREVTQATATFQDKINGVQAVLKPTADQLKNLSNEAKRLGLETKFSATQSAAAIEVLAKNGLKYQQIMGGALESSLLLAASTGSTIPEAADVATDAISIFNLKAEDLKQVVNSVNGTLINSKFGFDDYRLALANGGSAAVKANKSIDEFNVAIASTASFFSSGQTAGTAFKVFIDRLTSDTDVAAAAQKKLGVSFFDQAGNMRSLSNIAEQFKQSLDGLSDKDRIKSLKDIFGAEASNFAVAMSRAGAAGFENSRALIAQADAAEQAKVRMKGLNGALARASAAIEALKISFGESGLGKAIEYGINKVTEFAGWLAGLSNRTKNIIVVIAGIAVGITALAVALGAIAAVIPFVISGFTIIGTVLASIVSGVTAIIPFILGSFVAIKAAIATVAGVASAALSPIVLIIAGIAAAVHLVVTAFGGWGVMFERVKSLGQQLWQSLQGVFQGVQNVASAAWQSIGSIAKSVLGQIVKKSLEWFDILKFIGGFVIDLQIRFVRFAASIISKVGGAILDLQLYFLNFGLDVLGLEGNFKSWGEVASSVLDGIQTGLKILEVIMFALPDAPDLLLAAWLQFGASVLDIPRKIKNAFLFSMRAISGGLITSFAFIIKAIQKLANGLLGIISGTINFFIKAASKKFESFVNSFIDGFNEVADFFGADGIDGISVNVGSVEFEKVDFSDTVKSLEERRKKINEILKNDDVKSGTVAELEKEATAIQKRVIDNAFKKQAKAEKARAAQKLKNAQANAAKQAAAETNGDNSKPNTPNNKAAIDAKKKADAIAKAAAAKIAEAKAAADKAAKDKASKDKAARDKAAADASAAASGVGGSVSKAQDQIDGLLSKARDVLTTDAQRLEEEVKGWQKLLDLGKITQKEFDQLKQKSTDNFREVGDGVRSITDRMGQALDEFVETGKISFKSFTKSILADLAKIQLKKALAGSLQSLSGGATSGFGGIIGQLGKSLLSFNGGGFTGSGARSGGVDGKGGFPAILHPNETVIDHTKTPKGGRGGSSQIVVNETININAGVSQQELRGALEELDRNQVERQRRMVETGEIYLAGLQEG